MEQQKKSLAEYMRLLGWNQSKLCQKAGINSRTAKKAMEGEEIMPGVAENIAIAISYALGERVLPGEIEGLKIIK